MKKQRNDIPKSMGKEGKMAMYSKGQGLMPTSILTQLLYPSYPIPQVGSFGPPQ